MRTRFLNTDYFNPSSLSETLTFLNLPVPNLPPPPRDFNREQYLLLFDPLDTFAPPIQRPSVDSALSKFISDVIPQLIEFEDDPAHEQSRFSSRSDEKEAGTCYGEKEEHSWKNFGSEALEKSEEDFGDDNKHMKSFEVIQFEAPELDTFLENACFSEEHKQILFELPETENNLDLLSPKIQIPYDDKVQELVFQVEDVTVEFDINEKACELEDDFSVQQLAQFHHETFPVLEFEETSLIAFINPSIEEEFLSCLENVELKWPQEGNLHINQMELLGSVQYDVREFLSNHCLSKQCLESELASLDTLQGINIISMVETSQTREESADCFSPMNLPVFQEFKFLENDSSQLYEFFFEMQRTNEPEACDSMFGEDMNFKNFNELIVSCELTLADNTFKSLPLPIIADHDRIMSISAIMEVKLSELKPQPLSTALGIYLDWHLLEEDNYSCRISSPYQSMLEELDSHSTDLDWESFDGGKFVIGLVFSDDDLSEPQAEEHLELLNMISETSNSPFLEVASSKALDDRVLPGKREQLIGENAGNASLLFKSMSQFNDLDFFLNPGKVTARERSESAPEVPDNRASFPKVGMFHSGPDPEEDMNGQKFEQLLDLVPVEDKHNMMSSDAADKAETYSTHLSAPCALHAVKPERTWENMVSFPEIVIIVNTQDFDKEMIISRRGTYQRILAMEKEGAQVVERDLNLPVDVIISPSICLVWYDCGNIGKKATAADEASSCLPLCIDNIATNVLTSLSFTFSGCILVFEGDVSFLSTVMDSSDGLYAAAASLGIDLQLFCSYSSELTNEIILSSILCATKFCRGIYPKMPESETLAESFLTKFPSINPLTAHAILSSGRMLIEFLEWSHGRRLKAVQQYHVPVESVALFSALCKYGEREDSKSIMTDCSSSASSCPDSDKCQFHINSARKRRKCTNTPQKIGEHVDNIWHSEPENQFTDDFPDPGVFKRYNSWMSTDPEIICDLKQPISSLKDLVSQNQLSDIAREMDAPSAMKPFHSGNPKDPTMLGKLKQARFPFSDKFVGQNLVLEKDIASELKLDWDKPSKSVHLHEDFVGEVIDLTDDHLSLDKDVGSIAKSTHCYPWMPEIEQGYERKSKAARTLSFGNTSHPTFPTAPEINNSSDLWPPIEKGRQIFPASYGYPITNDNHDKAIVTPRKNLLEEVLTRRSSGNPKGFPFKEKISHFGGTPLSKAIHSTHPQPGSPWTVEFLNRIREKSRLRKQSLPSDASIQDFSYSRNISKVAKRRSPSILDFFKFQGGRTPGKLSENKKQKQPIRLSSSPQKERTSASLIPTWTPSDKKSKQTLSFAMDDTGSQTRLVWSDGGAHHLGKKYRRH